MTKAWLAVFLLCAGFSGRLVWADSSDSQDQGQQAQPSDDDSQDMKAMDRLAKEMRQKIEGGTSTVSAEPPSEEETFSLEAVSTTAIEAIEAPASLEPLQTELGAIEGEGEGAVGVSIGSDLLRYDSLVNQGAALFKSSEFQRVPQQTRAPLESQWGTIQAVRTDLLEEVPPLDSRQDAAVQELNGLNQRWAALQSRRAELVNEKAALASACTGTFPRPQYDACIARLNALNRAIAAYNGDLHNYQAQAASWTSRRDTLVGQIRAWGAKVAQWAASLEEVVGQAKEALKRAKQTTCTDERLKDLEVEMHRICDQGFSCTNAQDCKTLNENIRKAGQCRDARKKVVDECYGGKPTDEAHQKMLDEAEVAVRKCETALEEKRENIQRAIKYQCDTPECADDQDCDTLKKNLAGHEACARQCGYLTTCFDKPNPEVAEKQSHASKAIFECNLLIQKRCAPVGAPSSGESQ